MKKMSHYKVSQDVYKRQVIHSVTSINFILFFWLFGCDIIELGNIVENSNPVSKLNEILNPTEEDLSLIHI